MLATITRAYKRLTCGRAPRAPQRPGIRFSRLVAATSTRDVAPHLTERTLILVGSAPKYKWLRFLCPCGCGDELALNLMTSHYPHWSLSFEDIHTISIHPSVDSTRCGAHFWLKGNVVTWCIESTSTPARPGLFQRFRTWLASWFTTNAER